MDHPGRGEPYTVRSLAEAADCAPATIGHLLAGRQKATATPKARRITEALGCTHSTVFLSPASTDQADASTDDPE